MRKEKYLFNQLLLRYNKYRRKMQRLTVTGRNARRQNIIRKHIERLRAKLEDLYASIQVATATAMLSGAMLVSTPDSLAQSTPTFQTAQRNLFGLTDIGSYAKTALVDLDGDGDLDVFAGNNTTDFSFFENTGTITNPAFGSVQTNPFGLTAITSASGMKLVSPAFADMDNDGDLDLLTTYKAGDFQFFENTGTKTAPAFGPLQVNPMGLAAVGEYASLDIADLDGDGDFDVLTLDTNATFKFFENTGTKSTPAFAAAQDNSFGLSTSTINNYAVLSILDIDSDGDFDVLGSEHYDTQIYFFENTGTATAPAFAPQQSNPFRMNVISDLNVGYTYRVAPVGGDLDGDGDLDLLGGDYNGNFHFFENKYLNFDPVQSNPFGLTDIGSYSAPAFVDIDNDGDLDVFSGNNSSGNGEFVFFQNDGSSSSPAFAAAQTNPFSLTSVAGGYSAPTFVDIDGDGDYDLISGANNGQFSFFENTGTATLPAFAAAVLDPFNLTDIGNRSAPTFTDLDGDGDLDLLSGNSSGTFDYFENTGTVNTPTFGTVQNNPFSLTDIGDNSMPDFADIDQDGDFDLIAGQGYYGNFFFFENTGTNTSPSFGNSIRNAMGLGYTGYYANVSFGDIDNDGDLDVLTGRQGGDFRFFEFKAPAVFTSENEANVIENSSGTVLDVNAHDGVGGANDANITYELTGGADQARFAIDAAIGSLSFASSPDFEDPQDSDMDNVYEVQVQATNTTVNASFRQTIVLTVTDETPSVTLTVTADNATRVYATENPSLSLTYSGFLSGDDETALSTAPVVSTAATSTSTVGSYDLVPSGGVDEDRYLFNYVNGTLTVEKAEATVNLASLSQTYDGSQRVVTATTNPIGLTVDFTYDGSATAPITAGSYAVTGTIDNVNYQGLSNGTLSIAKAAATITLSNLEQEADGTSKEPIVTTDPSGLVYSLTFDGNTEKPTLAGQYEVLAAVDDTNYEGQTEGTFVLTAVLDVIEELRPVSVYPNPATDKFKVSTVESSELGVYDLNGTLLIRASTNQFVDVRNLNNGVYLVLAKNKIMRLVIDK